MKQIITSLLPIILFVFTLIIFNNSPLNVPAPLFTNRIIGVSFLGLLLIYFPKYYEWHSYSTGYKKPTPAIVFVFLGWIMLIACLITVALSLI
jgi:hypothetical protein